MSVAFLYPCHPLYAAKIDDHYQEEYEAAKNIGLSVYVIDIDNILESIIVPPLADNTCIVYRGWMLNQQQYTNLEQRFGNRLVTSAADYNNAHYFPDWYDVLQSLTIPSVITDEEHAHEVFQQQFPGKAFIKDYVKSLKTGKGSIVESVYDVKRALLDMKFYRGIIEGGIVLRNVVDLKEHSETRFFVVHNIIFQPNRNESTFQLVAAAVNQLKVKNIKFYSVDVATTKTGKNIIIEIGDGQVSDYVGWTVHDFVKVLHYLSKC